VTNIQLVLQPGSSLDYANDPSPLPFAASALKVLEHPPILVLLTLYCLTLILIISFCHLIAGDLNSIFNC